MSSNDDSQPETIGELAVHVRAAARPGAETDRLLAALAAGCWPAGVTDRTDPVARGWLRYAGPGRLLRERPACTCAEGRCRICN